MKKSIFILILSLVFSLPVSAGDVDLPASGDLWDNWNKSQDFYGQDKPAVSDEDFDKAIDSLKNKNRFGFKKKNKNIPKGEVRNNYEETDIYEENEESNVVNTLPVICIPVELSIGEGVLPVGHYQVQGEKNEDGSTVLKLYQAQYVMAQLPATETNEDFDEDTITFAKWLPEGENKIKIIYGSLDFNAFAYVNIK
jgi:hypothetical protein